MNKYIKTLCLGAFSGIVLTACTDMDEIQPEGGVISQNQLLETNEAVPERTGASLAAMYTMMGQPDYTLGSGRADDFGFIMMSLSNDLEGSDMNIDDSGYNWFSVCGEYSSRYANYANPYIRYATPYNQIKLANDIIASLPADSEDADIKHQLGQAKAIRAFDYLNLAPSFQFSYMTSKDQPCVPIITEEPIDYTNNPRATVEEVYNLIISDITEAIDLLDGFKRSNKTRVDQQVAYGIRARAYLNMGMYAEAAADAEKAMAGYTFASKEEVGTPAFCNLSEHNWIWGIQITADITSKYSPYSTSSSWVSPFSGDGYAAACQVVPYINNLLYDKISKTDVRKGWWLDENNDSPLLATINWDDKTGVDIANYVIEDVKMAFRPYFNVKFGSKSGCGTTLNDNDWCLMRAEEMLLIQIEGLAKSGQESKAKQMLENFVKNYRDAEYTIPETRTFENEIWFQRRVELWGEGFAMSDIKRLGKPVVRFHESSKDASNVPTAFRFNMAANDGWLLMRFPQKEMNNNAGIVDNMDGSLPVQDQNGNLVDGVTD